MAQPEYTRSGRRIKHTEKSMHNNDDQDIPSRKGAATTHSVKTSSQDTTMHRANSVDDLVSPMSTPAPATRFPAVSRRQQSPPPIAQQQQPLPTPVATSSAAVELSPMVSTRSEQRREDSKTEVSLSDPKPTAPAAAGPSAASQRANRPVRDAAFWADVEKRYKASKNKGVQKRKPLPPALSRTEKEAAWKAAASADPPIQKLRAESAVFDDAEEEEEGAPPAAAPAKAASANEAPTAQAPATEQPTSWARNRYGDMEPLYGGETHVPNGVQRHISAKPGTRGDWAAMGGVTEGDHAFRGVSLLEGGQRLSGVEMAAGVGRGFEDMMATSDEGEA